MIQQALKKKEEIDEEDLKDVEKRIKCHYITLLDKEYPTKLRSISNPPFVLFYYGNIQLLKQGPSVAMIGARNYSEYGATMAKKITRQLKEYNGVVVSGMAKGIDGIAQRIAIREKMKTIGVLGCGIETCYPKENLDLYENIKKYGLLISEYPNDLEPKSIYFLIRNRMIAALSEYIVVVEAKLKSGTMNTVAYGLEYGKEIFCVPSLATSESGCNALIKECAKLIETAKDIFE